MYEVKHRNKKDGLFGEWRTSFLYPKYQTKEEADTMCDELNKRASEIKSPLTYKVFED